MKFAVIALIVIPFISAGILMRWEKKPIAWLFSCLLLIGAIVAFWITYYNSGNAMTFTATTIIHSPRERNVLKSVFWTLLYSGIYIVVAPAVAMIPWAILKGFIRGNREEDRK